MAKFCSNCGKELQENQAVCLNCGVMVNKEDNSNNKTKSKDKGLIGFVCSLIGFFCCTYVAIPGLALSIMALKENKDGNGSSSNSKGFAIAGIILGVLGIIVMINNIINLNGSGQELINSWYE